MLTVGDRFPAYQLMACVSLEPGKEFQDLSYPAEGGNGRWQVLFLWPMDFTFVCPTEIAEFGRKTKDFADRDAVVLGGSTDNEFSHLAWRKEHPDLKDLPFPMIHLTPALAEQLGVIHRDAGVALRATFIADPDGVIRFVSVNDLSVGRNVNEVLRTLDALQTDELCPCNWEKGQPTL